MNAEVSEKIRALLGEDFLIDQLKGHDFKTKGNDLQFRLPSKNALKTNMIKIQETEPDVYTIKYFTYQPFKHIFNLIDFADNVDAKLLFKVLYMDLGIK